ncbi:MAG: hypothetical protein HOM04_08060 [Euryarchaeota archaeon]|jgi:hypothetical protein|nr:hypothetical protein [Euryarchaeota archaeon]
MLAKRMMAISLAAMMLSMLPPVSADDNIQSANPLTDGVTSNGYVCNPDCDAGNDQADFWKIEARKGDIVQIAFSGTMNGPAWWCPGDGWTGRFSILNSQGATITDTAADDNAASKVLSTSINTAGYVFVKIKSEDSWCNDGFDYTLTPSIDKSNRDTDEDGFIDNEDDCDDLVGTSTNDRKGCTDLDGDGWSDPDSSWGPQNGADAFVTDSTQWLDSDNDGFGDNLDGFQGDHCPFRRGYSQQDRFGCLDSDGDGYSDEDPGALDGVTAWYAHPLGFGDAFPLDATQWNDTDDDGFGDNWENVTWNQSRMAWGIGSWLDEASTPDACPFITGFSTGDRFGCTDSDGDGYSDGDLNWTKADGSDAFPDEPSQWQDRDFDGWGDNQSEGAVLIDDFPDNPTQWSDSDEDGWGDNQTYGATQVDDFPFVPSQYRDTDGDGYGDILEGFEGDVCVFSSAEEVESGWISYADRLGCRDVDQDGFSDPTDDWIAHPDGFADAFPLDQSQWFDTDHDGYGDNLEYFDGQTLRVAYRGDGCRTTLGTSTFDRWGCPDSDEDGWSDPTNTWLASPGGNGDAWPMDHTQWHDVDGDGRGDNPLGTTADVCPSQAGTSVGPSSGGDRWGCPDTDGDGWSDLGDAFIHEPTQWRDTDGDGFGDDVNGNQGDACPEVRGTSLLDRLGCRDTDGDGWSDPTESWQAHPFGTADSFPTESLQWRDSDSDGFGDVPLGALRDDCPDTSGYSMRDTQGCVDSNGDGWSDSYGEFSAAVAILGEDPAASWLTYLVIGFGFILGASLALIVRMGRDDDTLEDDLFESKESANLDSLTMDAAPVSMTPLEDLPPLPMPEGMDASELQPLPLQGGETVE